MLTYVLFTIFFTWPLAANFTTFFNGNVQDIFHELWYLHLGSTSQFGPFFAFYTNTIFYPTGVPLFFQVVSPFNTLIFAALSPYIGEIASYNFLYMFTFYAAAFTMYIFVKYLTKNKYAAFFSGLAFAFAPIHTSQGLAHLNIMSSEFIPLYGYFFIRMAREIRFRNALYAGAAMVLNAMCDLHMLLMALTITVCFLIFYGLFKRRDVFNKPFIKRFAIMSLFAGVLGITVYFQTLYGLLFVPAAFGKAAAITAGGLFGGKSSALSAFFIPANQNSFVGKYFVQFYTVATGVSRPPTEQIRSFIGYTVLSMAVIGLVAYRKKREVLFWLFTSAVGFMIALGPFVNIGGQFLPGIWDWLYYLVPFFSAFRTPYRFDYIVAFGFAILAGYGIVAIMDRISRARMKIKWVSALKLLVLALLVSTLVLEFVPIPYTEIYAVPPKIYQIIANDHSNFTVLEIPVKKSLSIFLYYQSYYNHPLINGGVARIPQYPTTLIQSAPFIDELGQYLPNREPKNDTIIRTSLTSSSPGNLTLEALQIAPYILAEYHVKYVILHKDLMTAKYGAKVMSFVAQALGPPFYQDNQLAAWKLDPQGNSTSIDSSGIMGYLKNYNLSAYSVLTGGWYKYTKKLDTRTMDVLAGLTVYSATNQSMQLIFRAEGIGGNIPLQLSVNGQYIGTILTKNQTYSQFSTQFFQLNEGINQVMFYSPNGCTTYSSAVAKPNKVAAPATNCISAQFAWIEPIVAPNSSTQG
ncbi:MAG: hypothetical protein ACYC7D_03190 [Nitrososphaerales archaeon]